MSRTNLLKFILVTLPLTNSVTLPVGFPLKLYEVAGLLLLGGVLTGPGVVPRNNGRVVALWGVFFFISLVPSAWGLYELAANPRPLLEWAHGRYHPLINTVFHYCYLALDIGLLLVALDALGRGWLTLRAFCRAWAWGALLSVVYAIWLNVVVGAGLPLVAALRWDEVNFFGVAGMQVVRTGPFEEGNFFGLYLLVSLTVIYHALRCWPDRLFRVAAPAVLMGMVLTASPAALLGGVVLTGVAVVFGRVSRMVRGITLAAGVLGVVGLVGSGLFQSLVLDKFSLIFYGGVTDSRNVSLVQRANESWHAWQMFVHRPWGVGMGNYGYFFGDYPDLYRWLPTNWMNFKPIPNNVYLEVLAEHGLVGFVLFMAILGRKLWRLVRAREFLVMVGFLLMGVYFFAFPTFRLAFIWLYWAFILAVGRDQDVQESPSRSVR